MTTNIPSYPRCSRSQCACKQMPRDSVMSLRVTSRKEGGFVDFGGGFLGGATKTVLSFESCRDMHLSILSNEDGQKGALLSF